MATELDNLIAALGISASALQASLAQDGLPSFRSDDPSPHPWDSRAPNPQGWYARKAVIGICHQIIALVQNPMERGIVDYLGFLLTGAMNVAVQTRPRVATVLLEAGAEGISKQELSQKTSLDETKLGSVLHVLGSWNYVKEVDLGRIVATRSTRALAEETLCDLHCVADPSIEASTQLPKAARLPSDSTQPTPFEFYHHVGVYDWLKNHPELMGPFSRAMNAAENILDPGLVADLPVEDLGSNITLVDVGSGVGGLTMQFLKRYSGWNAVLQDQAPVMAQAKFWNKEAPDLIKEGRVTFLSHNFFDPTPLPPAPTGKPYVFMIKSVLHNWPDDLARKILNNLCPAAPPGTKLMIVNYTPAEPGPTTATAQEFFSRIAGHSMLEIQNAAIPPPAIMGVGWGHGDAHISLFDLFMMLIVGSRCRTVSEIKNLLRETSWEFESKMDYRGATSVTKARRV